MNDVLKKIQKIGIVPVVVLEDASAAKPLADALCEGGLPCAEVTFRTAAAEEAIRAMAQSNKDMLIGAGTVLSTKQVDRAIAAGASFIVSPGLNPVIVTYCLEKNIPVIPGVTAPSQIEQAIELGLEVVKFFPAEAAGGLKMIKAMAAPYTTMKFMPTGGINEKNLTEYLAYPKILACGGSWMVSKELITAGRFDEIKRRTREAVQLMLGFELAHIGINCADSKEAVERSNQFVQRFGFEKKEGTSSIFAGNGIEILKSPFLGEHGHIAIKTNSIMRAINYLESKGYTLNEETARYKEDAIVSIYLNDSISGFAIHLLQK